MAVIGLLDVMETTDWHWNAVSLLTSKLVSKVDLFKVKASFVLECRNLKEQSTNAAHNIIIPFSWVLGPYSVYL